MQRALFWSQDARFRHRLTYAQVRRKARRMVTDHDPQAAMKSAILAGRVRLAASPHGGGAERLARARGSHRLTAGPGRTPTAHRLTGARRADAGRRSSVGRGVRPARAPAAARRRALD